MIDRRAASASTTCRPASRAKRQVSTLFCAAPWAFAKASRVGRDDGLAQTSSGVTCVGPAPAQHERDGELLGAVGWSQLLEAFRLGMLAALQ